MGVGSEQVRLTAAVAYEAPSQHDACQATVRVRLYILGWGEQPRKG